MTERWYCPTCGLTVTLYVPAHGRPCCPHGGTPRSAMREALMVRVDDDDDGGEGA